MEFLIASTFSLTLITITCIFLYNRHHLNNNEGKLPPGSLGWPILGETMEFLFGKPGKFVTDRMKKYSPDVFKTNILGEKTVVICGPNGHKFLFSNEEVYFTAFRPHSMQHLFRSYKDNKAAAPPPQIQATIESKAVRQPGFLKPEALMRFLGKMDHVVQQQVEAHCKGKNIVKVQPLAETTALTIVIHFFMGIDRMGRIARLEKYFNDVTVGMHCTMLNFPGTIFYRANKAANAIRKELLKIIDEKKQAIKSGYPLHDLLSYMILAGDPMTGGRSMPDTEIADKMMGLLTGGYSTVATTMIFLVKYIGLNPEVYQKVRAEQMEIAEAKKPNEILEWEDMGKMKYSWNVILETLRLVPPNQGTFREVMTEFTYAGYTIPKGWKLYWTVNSTNMNPEYFKNPEIFYPSRYDEGETRPAYAFVPFGGGPRLCPGKEYARVAILTFLHNLVKRYKWEVIDPNEKVKGCIVPEPQKGVPIRLYLQ